MTHQLQYLQLADQIVVMNNGVIEEKGTFEQLQALGLDFLKLLQTSNAKSEETENEKSKIDQFRRSITIETKDNEETSDNLPVEERETIIKGRMATKVFFAYFKASKKPFMITLMLLIFLVNQIISGGSDYFVAFWVNVETTSWHRNENDTTEFLWVGPLTRDSMIYTYSAMIATIVLLWQVQTVVYYSVCMWSSINLHSDMFRSILRATMYFYNTNPAGRILNR